MPSTAGKKLRVPPTVSVAFWLAGDTLTSVPAEPALKKCGALAGSVVTASG
jgi:hypothetical protein